MGEQRFLISDAAKMVAVEAHVLRYWEEELEIPVQRTELGHRYYTRENIEVFQNVKELKEKGLQLKAIKVVLQGRKNAPSGDDAAEILQNTEVNEECTEENEAAGTTALSVVEQNTKKLQQFEALVSEIVDRVVKENNDHLEERMEAVFAREMEYLLHMQEIREEERFRKLDESIRAHQKNSKQAAATREKGFFRKLRR